ncbi:MAG: HD domain-containing protein [Armatimonadota bacterium]|nr:HD domain-containing protein [Armatimonadota bacterium]
MILALCVILILSVLLSMHLLPEKVSLRVGDISNEEIRAHKTVRYIDTIATERLRQEAAKRTDKVYTVVPKAASETGEAFAQIIDVLKRARLDPTLYSDEARIAYVSRNLRPDLQECVDSEALRILLKADAKTFDQIQSYAEPLMRQIVDREIRDIPDDVPVVRAEFRKRLIEILGNTKYAAAVSKIGGSLIRPNRLFDPEATKKAQEREMRMVPPKYGQILLGEVVISKGERVTPEHIDKFTALGLSHPKADYVTMMCISILVACVVIFTLLYLARYHARIYRSTKLLGLLSLIVVLSVLGLKLGGAALGLNLSGSQSGYFGMIWIATAGMLTATLINPQVAVMIVALLSAMTGFAMNQELRWALAALVSGFVAIYSVSDIRHRSDLMTAAVIVSLTNLAIVWLIGRVGGDDVRTLFIGSGWAVVGGVSSIGLFWLGTTALEKPFGITTHNRLLELADTNNPILKRLLMEAPGTYSHSIFVGNIAAGAAEQIGADPLLVRVAAYYHDVGKMKRPHFFVENQYVENAHDGLNPSLSALVIRSHIKDGLELAKEYKLPPLICELMAQHHGTSVVKYFYHQATSEGNNESDMLEQHFRYDGTKPQSKEAALLMLADSVEAASRSLSKPTPSRIENLVDKIIDDRLADGQLDESDLTFKDISRIRDSFVRTLTSMMHARIEYPELTGTEGKKSANGSANKESSEEASESGKVEKGRSQVTAS